MIPLYLDLSELAVEFSLESQQVDDMISFVVKQTVMELARNWHNQANNALHSTRSTYQRSLIVGEVDNKTAYVELVGVLPNMLEKGASAWDMKVNFKKSNKIKYTKDGGWYLTVPFRFATPTALGESSIFSNRLPLSVYQSIRANVQAKKTQLGGLSSNGGSLKETDIPSSFRIPRSRRAFSDISSGKTFEQYTHKSSIFKGINRASKQYERANQSQYVSFRRVSSKSDPMSWIHRGLPALNLADKAVQNTRFDLIVDRSIDQYLSKMGF